MKRSLKWISPWASIAICAASGAAVADPGPIGWWKLDEVSGSVAADSSGGGNPGVIGPGVTLGLPGVDGTAFGFTPYSRVVIPYGSGDLAPPTNQITVSAWINPAGDWSCGGWGQCAVVSNEPVPGEDGFYGYGLRVISGGSLLQFCYGEEDGPTGDCAYGAYPFQTGTWVNIVGTYDGSLIRNYVNGVLVGTNAKSFPALNTTRDLVIGQLPSGDLPWNGLIDDVRVYDRVVSDIELKQLAHLLPETKAQCKNGGWQSYGVFKNQGDCVSWVATNGRNPPAGG